MNKTFSTLAASALALACLGACTTHAPERPGAWATLAPTQGNAASGRAEFRAAGPGDVRLRIDITGLAPHSWHGVHLHEKGDCSGPGALAAGGHFNPAGVTHGAPQGVHHAGDVPQLQADAQGAAHLDVVLHGVSVASGAADDVLGRALVVHADADDYKTQPTGNSGGRIACGVVLASH